MSSPYISVVIVGRNDDYGVNFLSRINTFIRSLDYQIRNYPDLFELIIVEWNPLPDRAPLKDVIVSVENLKLRIITVSPEIHNGINHPAPVLEYYGKNAGIRRAHGEFVLTTNPDIIFSDQLIESLSQKILIKDLYYRADRYDFISDGIDNVATEDLVSFACANVFQGHLGPNTTIKIGPIFSLTSLPQSRIFGIHTNAAGDFILAEKSLFFQVNGLVESTTVFHHLDSRSLQRIHNGCKGAGTFIPPDIIFHQHHERYGEPAEWNAAEMNNSPPSLGDESWGLKNQILHEWHN
jgi:hypothetical protein